MFYHNILPNILYAKFYKYYLIYIFKRCCSSCWVVTAGFTLRWLFPFDSQLQPSLGGTCFYPTVGLCGDHPHGVCPTARREGGATEYRLWLIFAFGDVHTVDSGCSRAHWSCYTVHRTSRASRWGFIKSGILITICYYLWLIDICTVLFVNFYGYSIGRYFRCFAV